MSRGDGKSEKDTTVYKFYSADDEELHCGRTSRHLHVREGEHRRKFDEPDGYAVAVEEGLSWEDAGQWERENRCSPYDRYEEDEEEEDDERGGSLLEGVIKGAAVVGGLWLVGKLLSSSRGGSEYQ